MSCLSLRQGFELPVPLRWGSDCRVSWSRGSKVLGKRWKRISDPGRTDQLITVRLPSSILGGEISLSGAFCAREHIYCISDFWNHQAPTRSSNNHLGNALAQSTSAKLRVSQKVQLAIRVIQPLHLQITQKCLLMPSCPPQRLSGTPPRCPNPWHR